MPPLDELDLDELDQLGFSGFEESDLDSAEELTPLEEDPPTGDPGLDAFNLLDAPEGPAIPPVDQPAPVSAEATAAPPSLPQEEQAPSTGDPGLDAFNRLEEDRGMIPGHEEWKRQQQEPHEMTPEGRVKSTLMPTLKEKRQWHSNQEEDEDRKKTPDELLPYAQSLTKEDLTQYKNMTERQKEIARCRLEKFMTEKYGKEN